MDTLPADRVTFTVTLVTHLHSRSSSITLVTHRHPLVTHPVTRSLWSLWSLITTKFPGHSPHSLVTHQHSGHSPSLSSRLWAVRSETMPDVVLDDVLEMTEVRGSVELPCLFRYSQPAHILGGKCCELSVLLLSVGHTRILGYNKKLNKPSHRHTGTYQQLCLMTHMRSGYGHHLIHSFLQCIIQQLACNFFLLPNSSLNG